MSKTENKQHNKNIKARHVRKLILTVFLDTAFASLAYFLARTILFFRIEMPKDFARVEPAIGAGVVIITVLMLVIFDCYNVIWKYAGRIEFFKFLLSYIGTFAILGILKIILYYSLGIHLYMPIIIMHVLFSAILSGLLRFISGILNYAKHVRFMVDKKAQSGMKRTIVIGAGYSGSLAINRFVNNPGDGYYPVAVVDDDEEKHGQRIYGILVEGGLDKLSGIVERYRPEAFVIAIMSLTKSQLKRIYTACSAYNLPIKIMPSITDAESLTTQRIELRDIRIEELLGRDEFKLNRDLIDASIKDKVVMVTGGAGSIGSELCRQVLEFGCRHLVVFDMHENGMFFLNEEFKVKYDTDRYSLVIGTVRERDKLKETLAHYKPDIIFHAAAYKHVPMMEIAPTEAIKNNVFGTLNTIELAEEAGVKKFVLISTDKAVNPSNIMGASKRLAEMLIETRGKTFNMKMAAVRFGNVLGSNGSVIPLFLKQIGEGGPITLTDRNIKRYFMSIPEAVRLVLQTGAFATSGEIFVLDMGEPVYIYDLACDLIRLHGLVPEQDIPIKITGLRPGEKMFEELRYDTEAVDTTAHEGVFVNKLDDIDREKFDRALARLRRYAFSEDEAGTERTVFTIVPSVYRDRRIAEADAKQRTERA